MAGIIKSLNITDAILFGFTVLASMCVGNFLGHLDSYAYTSS